MSYGNAARWFARGFQYGVALGVALLAALIAWYGSWSVAVLLGGCAVGMVWAVRRER